MYADQIPFPKSALTWEIHLTDWTVRRPSRALLFPKGMPAEAPRARQGPRAHGLSKKLFENICVGGPLLGLPHRSFSAGGGRGERGMPTQVRYPVLP